MIEVRELTSDAPEMRELNVSELATVSGGMTFGDFLHRLVFSFNCVAGGGELSSHGEQLHCRL
jgi:hypothetical protein